jgi:hypothetical protein
MSALMAVMRKMVAVTTHLMQTGEDYDPSKVWLLVRSGFERARCDSELSLTFESLSGVNKFYGFFSASLACCG